MLSYKNKDGGIGYFSSEESDVALSAFALMEFTELKKYVNPDAKIIQGLSSFILSRKSGNGLFEVRRPYESKKHILNIPGREICMLFMHYPNWASRMK
ncbi:hypothetical protein [Chryseobacterium sp. CH1]|uniref:hypothetical protein n=1 Tax=Chryseobacterium sp. CH1 TaxID=713551 RepID=UPI00100BBCE8|nr:hypothetical protein [Chryseobacterium sp. CH1]RXM60924.1 hypothetical protein BOQ60_23645 [Chryseobacterium sp. CH1]